MLRLIKEGKKTGPEGTTVFYSIPNSTITIESRKRHIPHNNGKPGTWDYTSYFVLNDGKEIKEFHSLRDAKEFAESYE